MAEFEDKLNAILADPEAMGQIVSIAKALTGEASSSEAGTLPPEGTAPEAPAASPAPAEEPEAPRTQPDWGAVLGMLGSLNSGGTGSRCPRWAIWIHGSFRPPWPCSPNIRPLMTERSPCSPP